MLKEERPRLIFNAVSLRFAGYKDVYQLINGCKLRCISAPDKQLSQNPKRVALQSGVSYKLKWVSQVVLPGVREPQTRTWALKKAGSAVSSRGRRLMGGDQGTAEVRWDLWGFFMLTVRPASLVIVLCNDRLLSSK